MASDGTIKISTELDSTKAQQSMSKFGQIVQKGFSGLTAMAKAGAKAVGAVSAGLTAAGGYAIKVGADFEAGMSQVQAVSGATADEMDRLTEKAKEMGAKTKFSASESAEAFNYMAMAGWKTEDMLDGIEGIMDLAAASGENLANTSDIVTDALTAFGLTAADSGHFADILAAASSNANTNVGMMGETFKYVAPLAGSLGYSAEDTATAIGLMANAGIKGSQAGTSLRSVMTRMAKPTEESANAMNKLGVSMEDDEGNMYSLMDVMKQVRAGFEGGRITQDEYTESVQRWKDMLAEGSVSEKEYVNAIEALDIALNGATESQKAEIAAELAGQEAMSGLLAIVNASEEDFEKLAKSIDNADGAAKRMAEIQLDNLQGQITLLKSAVDGLGVEIFLNMERPLKQAVEEGIRYVNQLTDVFKEDGLTGVVEEAGSIFGELSVEAAKQAPGMAESAVEFIQAFAGGLYDNKEKIGQAAKDIVFVFADGLAQILPESVREPIRGAIKEISKSFDNGGLKKATKTFVNTMHNISGVTGKLTKTVFPAFVKIIDFTGEHVGILTAAATTCIVAYKGFAIVNSTSSIIQKASTAFKASSVAIDAYNIKVLAATATGQRANTFLTIGQAAVGLLTGKVSLATAAQTLWNSAMNANPIGIVVTAIAALTAGIAVYNLMTDDTLEIQKKLDRANANLGNSFEKLGESSKDFYDGIGSAGTIFDNFNDAIIVSKERQQELASKMDEVQGQITEIAQNATEERRNLTEAEIQRMDELFEQMRNMAQQELDIESEYQAAVKDQAQSLAESHDTSIQEYEQYAQTLINSAEQTRSQVIAKAQEQYNEEVALLRQKYGEQAVMSNEAYANEVEYARKNMSQAVEIANQQCGETLNIIQQGYLSRSEATQQFSDSMQQMHEKEIAATEGYNARIKEIDDSERMQWNTKKAAKKKAEEEYNREIAEIRAEGTKNMTDEQVRQAGVWTAMVSETELYGGQLETGTQDTINGIINAMSSLPDETRDTMKNAMQPMLEEMQKSEPTLFQKASSIANGILSRLRSAFDINSPSRKTREIFRYVMKGAELGISDEENNLYSQTGDVAGNIMDKFSKLDIGAIMKKVEDTVFGMPLMPSAAVMEKIIMPKIAVETGTEYAPYSGIDYGRMGEVVKRALDGIKVDIDGRMAGEILSPYVDKSLGTAEKWKERQ